MVPAFRRGRNLKIQCIRKVFTALHFFHMLLCYSLIPKCIKFIIFLKILQTIPHNDNVKEDCLKSLQIYKKNKIKKNHIYRFTAFAQYFVEAPLASITVSNIFGYDATSFDHHHLAIICHSSPCLFTSQTLSGWMGQMHIFRFLQKYLIGFNPRLWLGHSRTFTELSISHSCCVFRFIVLLEGEPSAQFEVLNSLDMLFIKTIPIFWCIELFFYSDESLSPTEGKQPHSVRLLPAHCTFTLQVMSRAGFLQT